MTVWVCVQAAVAVYLLYPLHTTPAHHFKIGTSSRVLALFAKAGLKPTDTVTTRSIAQCCVFTMQPILASCHAIKGQIIIGQIVSALEAVDATWAAGVSKCGEEQLERLGSLLFRAKNVEAAAGAAGAGNGSGAGVLGALR